MVRCGQVSKKPKEGKKELEQFVADDPVLQASCLLLSWCVCLCVCVFLKAPRKICPFSMRSKLLLLCGREWEWKCLFCFFCVRTSYLHHWMLEWCKCIYLLFIKMAIYTSTDKNWLLLSTLMPLILTTFNVILGSIFETFHSEIIRANFAFT